MPAFLFRRFSARRFWVYFVLVLLTATTRMASSETASPSSSLSDSSSLSASLSPTPSPSKSGTNGETPTSTASLSVSGSVSLSGTVSETPTISFSSSLSDSRSSSNSMSTSCTPTVSGSVSVSTSGSDTASPSVLASGSVSTTTSPSESPLSGSASESGTASDSTTASNSGTESPSQSDSASESPSPSVTATESMSSSETATGSSSASGTGSETQSASTSASESPTESQSASDSQSLSISTSVSSSATVTATVSLSPSATSTVSLSSAESATASMTTAGSNSHSSSASQTQTASLTMSSSASTSRTSSSTASPSQLAFMSPSPTSSPSPHCHPACANGACSSFGGGPETCLGECNSGFVAKAAGGCAAAHNVTVVLSMFASSLTSCDAFRIQHVTAGSVSALAASVAEGLSLEISRVLFSGIDCLSSSTPAPRLRRQLQSASTSVSASFSVTNLLASDVPVLQTKVPTLVEYMPPVTLAGLVFDVTDSSIRKISSVCDSSCETCVDGAENSCITCAGDLELLGGSPGKCGSVRYIGIAATDARSKATVGKIGVIVIVVLAAMVVGLFSVVVLLLCRCGKRRQCSTDPESSTSDQGKANIDSDPQQSPAVAINLIVDGDPSNPVISDGGRFETAHRKTPKPRNIAHLASMMKDLNPEEDTTSESHGVTGQDERPASAFKFRTESGSKSPESRRKHDNLLKLRQAPCDGQSGEEDDYSGAHSPKLPSTHHGDSPHSSSRLSPRRLGSRHHSKRSESQLRRYHAAASSSVVSSRPSTPQRDSFSRASSEHSLVLPINALAEAVLHEAKTRLKKHHSRNTGSGKKRRSRSKAR